VNAAANPVRREPLADAVIAERLETVRDRIASTGVDVSSVRIVAVTKGFSVAAVHAALALGLPDVGENYADELIEKAQELSSRPVSQSGSTIGVSEELVSWHYLGAIQRRRVKHVAPLVSTWQTVCRVEEARTIADHAPGARVLVEVESTGIAGRNGCAPSSVEALVAQIRSLDIDLCGLMTVGPPGSLEGSRSAFRTTARLAADLGLEELSMGMTDDLEVGVEEGATIVRVGRALFGERDP
jgi:uncharacterized pyridoxal phosphate-containing UPF0001 family protein